MSQQRYAKAESAARVGAAGHLLLAFIQGTFGWFTQSRALMADAAYSASRSLRSFGTWVGMRNKESGFHWDLSHERMKTETAIAVTLSSLLILIGTEVGWNALKSMYYGVTSPPRLYALAAIVIAVAMKELLLLYRFRQYSGRGTQSMAPHVREHRMDLQATGIALFGIGGALIGHIFELPILYYADPAASLCIAGLIIYSGVMHARTVIETIRTSKPATKQEESELIETVQRVHGVITVEKFRAQEYGHYVVVELAVSVNPNITLSEGQEIARSVKQHLMKRHTHLADADVHVLPYDPGYPYKTNNELQQEEFPTLLQ